MCRDMANITISVPEIFPHTLITLFPSEHREFTLKSAIPKHFDGYFYRREIMLFTFCKNFDGKDTTNDTMSVTTVSQCQIFIFLNITQMFISGQIYKNSPLLAICTVVKNPSFPTPRYDIA